MKMVKLIILISLGLVMVFGLGDYWLRRGLDRGLAEMGSKEVGTQWAAPLVERITVNLGGLSQSGGQPGFLETYVLANEIGMAIAMREGPVPESSQALPYIDERKRLDFWGHPFCLDKRGPVIVVVSQGPNSNPMDCAKLRKELGATEMKKGFLYRYSSGALAVVIDRTD